MGVMNVVAPLFGGMPMCHGAGGLASQYYYGARTGGASIMEGTIEVLLGLFLGRSLRALLGAFPMPIVGGMMAVVGVQLGKFGLDLRGRDLAVIIITGAVSVATSMALGFLTGILLFHAWTWLRPRKST